MMVAAWGRAWRAVVAVWGQSLEGSGRVGTVWMVVAAWGRAWKAVVATWGQSLEGGGSRVGTEPGG